MHQCTFDHEDTVGLHHSGDWPIISEGAERKEAGLLERTLSSLHFAFSFKSSLSYGS